MILVDTSVWIDHFRRGNDKLASHLHNAQVLCHPFIVGELACGNLTQRGKILSLLAALPQGVLADHDDVITFIETHRLTGTGIGWIDAHLLASAMLSDALLWTMDKPLARGTRSIGIHADP